ncbi:hypothetical protein DFH08DRAFT_814989 [Mycena albidolilacea]|uniref:Uncharacterized protein n=1 Tax=Mycena albidolilacea TaxID=1033008 RepID=A0AAD6ZNE4_9AGAR|nr:hypothetical protein DFH08DRAFT_814989 [Mycena albidolilacea]
MARAPAKVVPKLDGDRKKVASVQRLLQREIDDPDPTADLVEDEASTDDEDGNGSDDSDDDSDEDMPRAARPAKQRGNTELFMTDELIRKLGNYTKPVLVWVCWTLSLRAVPPKPPKPPREPRVTREQWDRLSLEESLYWKTTTKAALIETLMNWGHCGIAPPPFHRPPPSYDRQALQNSMWRVRLRPPSHFEGNALRERLLWLAQSSINPPPSSDRQVLRNSVWRPSLLPTRHSEGKPFVKGCCGAHDPQSHKSHHHRTLTCILMNPQDPQDLLDLSPYHTSNFSLFFADPSLRLVEEEQGALRDSDRVVSINIALGHGLADSGAGGRVLIGVRCGAFGSRVTGRAMPRPIPFESALAIPRVVGEIWWEMPSMDLGGIPPPYSMQDPFLATPEEHPPAYRHLPLYEDIVRDVGQLGEAMGVAESPMPASVVPLARIRKAYTRAKTGSHPVFVTEIELFNLYELFMLCAATSPALSRFTSDALVQSPPALSPHSSLSMHTSVRGFVDTGGVLQPALESPRHRDSTPLSMAVHTGHTGHRDSSSAISPVIFSDPASWHPAAAARFASDGQLVQSPPLLSRKPTTDTRGVSEPAARHQKSTSLSMDVHTGHRDSSSAVPAPAPVLPPDAHTQLVHADAESTHRCLFRCAAAECAHRVNAKLHACDRPSRAGSSTSLYLIACVMGLEIKRPAAFGDIVGAYMLGLHSIFSGRAYDLDLLVHMLVPLRPAGVALLGEPGVGTSTSALSILHRPEVVQTFGAWPFLVRSHTHTLAAPPANTPPRCAGGARCVPRTLVVLGTDLCADDLPADDDTRTLLTALRAMPCVLLLFTMNAAVDLSDYCPNDLKRDPLCCEGYYYFSQSCLLPLNTKYCNYTTFGICVSVPSGAPAGVPSGAPAGSKNRPVSVRVSAQWKSAHSEALKAALKTKVSKVLSA